MVGLGLAIPARVGPGGSMATCGYDGDELDSGVEILYQNDNSFLWVNFWDWFLLSWLVGFASLDSFIPLSNFWRMTPKARADIHVNLPALQKLDSMLIETLDSMVNTEFWYKEVGSRAEGRTKIAKQSKRWWLPFLMQKERNWSIRVRWCIKSSRLPDLLVKMYCLKCLYQPLSGMRYPNLERQSWARNFTRF